MTIIAQVKRMILATMVVSSVASAATFTNTFDQLSPTLLLEDGFAIGGITFRFSGGSATYGNTISTLALGLEPLSDPVLDGEATGTLTLDFQEPTAILAFDFVLGPLSTLTTSGVTVAMSGPDFFGLSPQSAATNEPNEFMLATGSFSYAGTPFTQAMITFSSAAQLFAIDNLVYSHADAQSGSPGAFSGVPEPGTCSLMLAAGVLGAARLRSMRRSVH